MGTGFTWGGIIILVLATVLLPRPVLAINADDLLNLLVEEKVITPEKAEKLKQKAKKLEKAREAEERAKRAQELEQVKQEAKTEAKAEAAKEAKAAAEKAVPKPKVVAGYNKGFYVETSDGKFRTRMRIGIQPRFVYIARDHNVVGNEENAAYLKMRRLRIFLDGNAFDKDLKYYLQIQLEPNSAVNMHDASVWYDRLKFIKPWIGRGKVPYGLEWWQSGFLLNFIERPIFAGENDNNWPGGGNAPFTGPPAVGVGNNTFPLSSFHLYRSQGVMLLGDLDFWAPRNLRYWAGIWNGVNTRGVDNLNDGNFLYTGRILFAPLPNGGPTEAELIMQGDYNYTQGWPLFFVMGSLFHNQDLNRSNRPGTAVPERFDVTYHGYDLAACLKWHGFSLQAEWAQDTFTEKRPQIFIPGQYGQGDRTAHREAWYIAAGQFLWPKRLEAVFRYVYVNRLKGPDDPYAWSYLATNANQINYLFPVWDGSTLVNAREGILREYTAGLNFYVSGHSHKYMVDYSRLIRQIYGVANQNDNRFRFMAQWIF